MRIMRHFGHKLHTKQPLNEKTIRSSDRVSHNQLLLCVYMFPLSFTQNAHKSRKTEISNETEKDRDRDRERK